MSDLAHWVAYVSGILDAHNGAISAVASLIIAVFTIVLAVVTNRQARLTRDALKLANQEFVSTHRPKMVVRELVMYPPTNAKLTAEVKYVVANVGDGWGEIVRSYAELQMADGGVLEPLNPMADANRFADVGLEPGDRAFDAIVSKIVQNDFGGEQFRQRQMRGEPFTPNLYFRGFVVYKDRNDVHRRTSFCRGYIMATQRFRVTEDPDYEYAD